MEITRAKKIAGTAASIIAVLVSLGGAAVWAGDQRYVTKDRLVKSEIRQIRDQIADLEVQRGYAKTDEARRMFAARIAIKQNRIKQLETK